MGGSGSKEVSCILFMKQWSEMASRLTLFWLRAAFFPVVMDFKNPIDVERGKSIYQADLDDVRARLEDVTWVKSAVVERHLPDTVYIRLIENSLALWQKNNKLSVVDEDGVVLTDMGLERFKNLLIIVGEHAPIHAAELVATIEAEPDLKSRVK